MLYELSSISIVLVMFVCILVLNEVCFRLGRFVQDRTAAEIKTLSASVQGSILGILALLLGFTFSMAMQRYDSRSQALVEEVNAIGTVLLRAELLAPKHAKRIKPLMEDYIDLRIESSTTSLVEEDYLQQESCRSAGCVMGYA